MQLCLALLLGISMCCVAVQGKDVVEAARDLLQVGDTDPQGFTLMLVSIGILFFFAISLMLAVSLHVFKRKPSSGSAPVKQTPDD